MALSVAQGSRTVVRYRVLIIDKNRRIVDQLQDHFERDGFEPEVALSGDVGLSIVSERRMNVAVLDANMGKEDDWNLLRDLKRKDPSLPVVLINGPKGGSRVARRAGAERYVSSPLDPAKVISAVNKIARN